MSRYSLNLRPRYAEDELTTGEMLSRGVTGFFDAREKRQQADREWENSVYAQGGTIEPEESGMDRLRGIGAAIKRRVRPGADPTKVGLQTGIANARDNVVPGMGRAQPTPTYVPQLEQYPNEDWSGAPRYPGAAIPPDIFQTAPGQVPARAPAQPPRPNPALGGAPPAAPAAGSAGGVSDEIKRYTMRGPHGQRATIDPLYGARKSAAEYEITQGRPQDRRRHEEVDEIVKAAMAADPTMSEGEARVRALTGRWEGTKYRPIVPRSGLTREDRLAIEDRIDKRQARHDAITREIANNRNLTAVQIAKLRAEQQQIENDTRVDADLLNSADREAATASSTVGKLAADPIAQNTPGGQVAIGEAQRKAAEAEEARRKARESLAGRSRGAGAGTKRTIGQAEYDRAVAMGKTDAEIAAAYTIDSSVRRRR